MVRRLGTIVMAIGLTIGAVPVARAAGPALGAGLIPMYEDPKPAYDWQGEWSLQEVTLPSHRTGAQLFGELFTPNGDVEGRLPVVVIVPGSGGIGVQSMYHWAARDLAGHGYVALAVDPQGVGKSETFGADPCEASDPAEPCAGVPYQRADNFVDAFTSGIDFVLSAENPARSIVDSKRVGIAGHSLAARAASWLQGEDRRIKAVVAWDNLATDLQGDSGSASGGGAAGAVIGGELPGGSRPVTPRVPALGLASDMRGTTNPADGSPDLKKTGYGLWRDRGVPTMEVVPADATHLNYAQSARANEAQLHLFAYFTRAWFDRFLRRDRSATTRLLAPTILDQPRATALSDTFRSAAFLDGHDCPDLTTC